MQSFIYILIVFVGIVSAQVSFLDNQVFLRPFRMIRTNLLQGLQSRGASQHQEVIDNKKLQEVYNGTFFCDTTESRSDSRPNSVHKLRPGDIDIVGVMGDSLSVGYGLKAVDILGVLVEHRGSSFVGGGEKTWREYLTLPNILKVFNPNLIGYSLKDVLSTNKNSQFNVAEGGAVSSNLPHMVTILIKRILTDPRVNNKNDWKMIFLNMGSNDFCSEVCYWKNPYDSITQHINELKYVMRTLKKYLPRTIVVHIPPPHVVHVLVSFNDKPEQCYLTHKFECPCVFNNERLITHKKLIEIVDIWRRADLDIDNDPEFHSEDFAIVSQPFAMNYSFPRHPGGGNDFSYLSHDCFHMSQKGNAKLAHSLWNNLFEPVGKKSFEGTSLKNDLKCPTKENPYIFTRINSDLN